MTSFGGLIKSSSRELLGLLASLGFSAVCQASPVHYTFELIGAAGGPTLGSFTYTTADFITADVLAALVNLDSCTPVSGAACSSQEFHVSSVGFASGAADIADVIGFSNMFSTTTTTSFHYFANGAFGAAGVYTAGILRNDFSRLTVAVDAPTHVPEPATWSLALLALGVVGVGSIHRRAATS